MNFKRTFTVFHLIFESQVLEIFRVKGLNYFQFFKNKWLSSIKFYKICSIFRKLCFKLFFKQMKNKKIWNCLWFQENIQDCAWNAWETEGLISYSLKCTTEYFSQETKTQIYFKNFEMFQISINNIFMKLKIKLLFLKIFSEYRFSERLKCN